MFASLTCSRKKTKHYFISIRKRFFKLYASLTNVEVFFESQSEILMLSKVGWGRGSDNYFALLVFSHQPFSMI